MSNAATALASVRATLDRLTPTARRPLLGYAAYTLALFGLFVVVTFPFEAAVRQGLYQALGRQVSSEVTGARLGWSLGTSIDDLQLLPAGSSGPPLLHVQAFHARPSILGLLRGSPFPVSGSAKLYGGTLEGSVDPRPTSFDVDATLTGLDLARYTGLTHFGGGTMRGRVNLTTLLQGDRTAPTTLNGRIALTAIGLAVEGVAIQGVTLPDLHFGQLQAGGTITDGRVDITQLTGDGTELDLAGSGHLLLRDPPHLSLLSLEITLTPTAAAPKGIRMAVTLIPGEDAPNEGRNFQVSGPIGAPKVH